MSPEQKQLEQIEGRLAAHKQEIAKYRNHEWAKGDALHYYEAPDDVDFLLSLVKEQEGDDYIRGAYESICGPVRDAAATAMRSACIKRLKELAADVEHGDALLSAKAVITELESLSIEKPKE